MGKSQLANMRWAMGAYAFLILFCAMCLADERTVDCAAARAASVHACEAFGRNSAVCSLAHSETEACNSGESQRDMLGEEESESAGRGGGRRRRKTKSATSAEPTTTKSAAKTEAVQGTSAEGKRTAKRVKTKSATSAEPTTTKSAAMTEAVQGTSATKTGCLPTATGKSLQGMFGEHCSDFALPPCSSLAKDGDMKPVKLDDKVKTGAQSVKVGTYVHKKNAKCEWLEKNSCTVSSSLERSLTWREDNAYMGVSVIYNCLPQFRKLPEIKSGGKSNVAPTQAQWISAMTDRENVCANTLTLSAPSNTSRFKAQEVVLKSTYDGLLCNSPGATGFTQLNVMIADDKNKIYANSKGQYSFKCEKAAKTCTIKLDSGLATSKLKLMFRCIGFSGNKKDKSFKWSAKWSSCYGGAKYGFADTARMGTKLQLDVQIRSAMTDFVWSQPLKDSLIKDLTASPQLNCTAVLESCHLDAHFTQWKIPNYGEFEQSPQVLSPPIGLTVRDEVWNVTVSKKRFIKAGESTLEKRMVCFNAPKRAKECCVTKQLMEVLKSDAKTGQMAQARLENF